MFLPLPQKIPKIIHHLWGQLKNQVLYCIFSQGRTSYLNTCVTHLKFSAVIWSTYIRENCKSQLKNVDFRQSQNAV